jgi:hypothetical protein
MSGVDNPMGFARKRLDAVGWGGLSETQRHVLAVRTLIDEVRNGGFLQYFVNSSGNYWRDAVDGLAAIGADRDKQLLEEVLRLFGTRLPSEVRYERHHQVSAIVKRDDRPFEDAESRFYEDENDREVLLHKYILVHVHEFREK